MTSKASSKKDLIRWVLAGVLVTGGGLMALLSFREAKEVDLSKNPEVSSVESNPINSIDSTGALQDQTGKPAMPVTSLENQEPTPTIENKTPEKLEQERQAVFTAFPFKEKIQRYDLIAKKVLRPETESTWLKQTQDDPQFVGALKDLLTTPAKADAELSLQNSAIDVLIEAVKENPRGPASEVLNEVVQNASIEDSKIPQPLRENLAGIKGEVMMKWISSVPEEEADMGKRLPGPVSEKVWQNVLAIKDNNLKESQQLQQ